MAVDERRFTVSRVLAVGHFDYSRHTLTALAKHGVDIRYGYVGKPKFFPEESERLRHFWISRENQAAQITSVIDEFRPDVVFVGTASYDGSNQVARDLLDAETGIPMIRFYKEFRIRPSVLERRVLCGADGLVAGGVREALYARAVYGLPEQDVYVYDPDVISLDLLTDETEAKLSDADGEPHVMLGGNLKADDSEFDYRELIGGLAEHGVHVHVFPVGFSRWLAPGRALDPDSAEVRQAYAHLWDHPRVHLEEPVFGGEQIRSWSRFDAGLTQRPPGVFWPELTPVQNMNLPSKYSYYLAAGLPIVIHHAALPALQSLLAGEDVTIVYSDIEELAGQLRDLARVREMGRQARTIAPRHTADAGVPGLLAFVEQAIGRVRERVRG